MLGLHRSRPLTPLRTRPRFPPAGAAGIKQAQGFLSENPAFTIALAVGVVALIWILIDDDDEDTVSTGTTGT